MHKKKKILYQIGYKLFCNARWSAAQTMQKHKLRAAEGKMRLTAAARTEPRCASSNPSFRPKPGHSRSGDPNPTRNTSARRQAPHRQPGAPLRPISKKMLRNKAAPPIHLAHLYRHRPYRRMKEQRRDERGGYAALTDAITKARARPRRYNNYNGMKKTPPLNCVLKPSPGAPSGRLPQKSQRLCASRRKRRVQRAERNRSAARPHGAAA